MKVEELGPTIDRLYQTREKRLQITKEVEALKVQERELRSEIIETLEKVGLAKASGHLATCGITTSTEPVIEDWDSVHRYIRENDRFDLLQKRISVVAWRDLLVEGTLVPGTGSQEVVDVSLTKSVRG